jgi:two-component system nitrate/nitrite response regulator NarP
MHARINTSTHGSQIIMLIMQAARQMPEDRSETPARQQPLDLAVVGGNPWFVATLQSVLADSGEFALCVASDTPAGVLARLDRSAPSIVIVSARAYDSQIASTVRRLRQFNPQSRVVLHLPGSRPAQIRDAMQAGAWGLFCHEDGPDVMFCVLKAVAAGRLSFPYVDLAGLQDDPFEQLSGREMEVLEVLARGWTNMQISARLGISENTVKYHLKLIYEKLGVPSRAAAVARYLERQLG